MNYKSSADVDFWKGAQEITKEVNDGVKAEGHVAGEAMLYIRISPCNTISSLGSFNFDDVIHQQPYKLHESFFCATVHNLSFMFVHHNHTINGKMSRQITHDASRVEIHDAEKFASLCFGRFIEIARGPVHGTSQVTEL